ncbi:retrovirus-related pol polyprotein from transposon TNT 1-94 [Tanacetum coccineum]
MFTQTGYIWRLTGQTFTIVGNVFPLTRITTTTEVPPRKPNALVTDTPKPVVTLVYSRKPRKSKIHDSVSKPKIIKSLSTNNKEPNKSWGSTISDVPYSSLNECRSFKLFSGIVKFGNDHVVKIMGYGDYQIGNVMISRVYYVEGLGHNLFFVGKFYDSNLKVAFRQHTCFIYNLEGVDLLTGSRGNSLYTLSLGDMMASSPICILSKASTTKSWLWHRRLSYLNFGAVNHLAIHGLVLGLPKLKFEKDHLCSACAMGKRKKKPNKPKSEDTNQEKLYLLYMDLCGPMRIASVNGKKYILVIVGDYSQFTWVKCLRSKDEAPDFIIKFLKMIQVRLKAPVLRIRTDNETDKMVCNCTLIEAAHTILIYAKAPFFLWAKAVATACYTQYRFIIRLRHGKTPYELLHDKVPNLSFLHVFGALCYPTNDSENLGKLLPKADIDFDELTAMASEHSSLEPALHEMTPDMLFPPPFNELLNPPPSGDLPSPKVIALIAEVVAPEPAIEAMKEELNEFKRLEVWELIPRPDKVMVITLKWIYKVKLDELGGILKNKARLVARGYRQEEGIDFEQLFAPMARLEAIHIFLAFASHINMVVYQMDVKTTLLNGILREEDSSIALTAYADADHAVTSTNEGAGVRPKVPDVPKDDSESEEESWTFSQDDYEAEEEFDMNDDNKETKSDNDGDDITHPNLSTYQADDREEEKDDEDELYSDQRVYTPPDYQLIKEEENCEGDNMVKEVSVAAETPSFETTTPQPPIPNTQPLQQTPDSTTTTTIPTVTLPYIPNFASLFRFEQRVSALETEMYEFKQTSQFAKVVSSILGIVNNYLASKIKDAVDVAVQLQSNKLREEAQAENEQFLNLIEKYVTESLGAEVLVRSTNQPQMSYAVAALLSEFELKRILIDKIEENKSINIPEIHKNLYNALVEPYNSNKDIITSYGDVVTLKRGRDDQDKDEDPSLDQTEGQREGDHAKNLSKSAHAEEHGQKVDDLEDQPHQEFNTGNDDVTPIREALDDESTQSLFNEFLATPNDFSAFIMHWLKIDNLTQEVLTGPTYDLIKGMCKSIVELEYHLEEVFKATNDQLA